MAQVKKMDELTTVESGPGLARIEATSLSRVDSARSEIERFNEEDWRLIRKTYAPTLDDNEFLVFMRHARMEGLNPFKRQIYAYAANGDRGRELVFITSIQGFRARLERVPGFEGMVAAPVYANDDFRCNPTTGKVHHEFGATDRGPLMGAWAMGSVAGRRPIVVYLSLQEFKKTGKGAKFWDSMPSVMITKTAEGHVARKLAPEELGNTYLPEEMGGISLADGSVQMPDMPGDDAPKPKKLPSAAERGAAASIKLMDDAQTLEDFEAACAKIQEQWKLINAASKPLIKARKEARKLELLRATGDAPPPEDMDDDGPPIATYEEGE